MPNGVDIMPEAPEFASELNVGGHLSLERNPATTVAWAADNGFQSMQIFASSPGAWRPPVVDERRCAAFVQAREERGVSPLYIHAIYLINLGSQDAALVARSEASLAATLRAGSALRAAGVITHLGSHAGRGFDTVAGQISNALAAIVEGSPDDVDLVLENSAGSGGNIGSTLTELAALIDGAGGHPRLKVALDTAHLCGSGWDFSVPGTAERLVSETDHTFGLNRLVAIHANDSAVPCGSRKDRHANIGEGHIGLEGFRALLAQPELRSLPWILETPDLERRIDDRAALQALAVQPLEIDEPTRDGPIEAAG